MRSTVEIVYFVIVNLLIRYLFVGPGRIPIFCVHFCSSLCLIYHLFLCLRSVLFGYTSFAVLLLMSKQLVRVGIQTN